MTGEKCSCDRSDVDVEFCKFLKKSSHAHLISSPRSLRALVLKLHLYFFCFFCVVLGSRLSLSLSPSLRPRPR